MANTGRVVRGGMPFTYSKLDAEGGFEPTHQEVATPGTSTPVDVFNASNPNLVEQIKDRQTNATVMRVGSAKLAVLLGDVGSSDELHEIEELIYSGKRTTLYVPGPRSEELLSLYRSRTMYNYQGYRDYGISYSFSSKSGAFRDVGCFWDDNNRTATVVIPHAPTLAGLNRVSTIMKKADIMISYHPPLEVADGEQSMVVSMARQMWQPKIHIYADQGTGKILASGSDRIVGIPSHRSESVLRWSSGDLERGPINSFEGYPKAKRLKSTRRKRA